MNLMMNQKKATIDIKARICCQARDLGAALSKKLSF